MGTRRRHHTRRSTMPPGYTRRLSLPVRVEHAGSLRYGSQLWSELSGCRGKHGGRQWRRLRTVHRYRRSDLSSDWHGDGPKREPEFLAAPHCQRERHGDGPPHRLQLRLPVTLTYVPSAWPDG